MKCLLDTHIFIWWIYDQPELSQSMRDIIKNPGNEIYVSSVSALEIAIKYRLGKINRVKELVQNFEYSLNINRFKKISVNNQHAIDAGLFSFKHRDPFDRLLIAQSRIENLKLITNDATILTILDADLSKIPRSSQYENLGRTP